MPQIICPHCERSMAEHDAEHCRRKMSRRFFFGVAFGGLAAGVAAKSAELPRSGVAIWRAAKRADMIASHGTLGVLPRGSIIEISGVYQLNPEGIYWSKSPLQRFKIGQSLESGNIQLMPMESDTWELFK